MPNLVRRVAAARPDVLFVAAYLDDGVRSVRETVRQHVPLVASIGTSSSFCMPAFGARLGRDALGLFASDKPDAEYLDPSGLVPATRHLLSRATDEYERRYATEMSATALSGFAAGWALFRWAMPGARALTPQSVAEAALRLHVPIGGLANGSGVRFSPSGSPQAGANLNALGVIWEWVGVDKRAVVWPPRFATTGVEPIPLAS
jgi:hypothetical protein